jgi:DNA-directed RNA polymerase specialized sigma24 family protein
MTQRTPDQEPASSLNKHVYDLICNWVASYHAWKAETQGAGKSEREDITRDWGTQLYHAIIPSFRIAARGLVAPAAMNEIRAHTISDIAIRDAASDLADHCFSLLVDEMPRLNIERLDPNGNVVGWLWRIVVRKLYEDENDARRDEQNLRPPSRSSPEAGDPDGQVWPKTYAQSKHRKYRTEENENIDEVDYIADPDHDDDASWIIEKLHNVTCFPLVTAYLNRQEVVVQEIIRMRYYEELPFAEISARLGTGWTESTVRMRHFRTVQRLRTYLKARGCFDEDV